jgi:hypothetical protein
VLVAAASAVVPANAGGPKATMGTFAGYWEGHTRGLQIARSGRAKEHINDGCCHAVIDIRYRVTRPRGVAGDATATTRVTAVTLHNKAIYWRNRPRPHVGQVGMLRLKNHVITDSITGTIFCGPGARIGRCGA